MITYFQHVYLWYTFNIHIRKKTYIERSTWGRSPGDLKIKSDGE